MGTLDYLQKELEYRLRSTVAIEFWECFEHTGIGTQDVQTYKDGDAKQFIKAVRILNIAVTALIPYVDRMDQIVTHYKKVSVTGRAPAWLDF